MTNKIAFITGGSRGIGRNAALSLARRGVDVIFSYHANQAAAEATVAEIEKLGRKGHALRLDTGDSAQFDAFVGQFKQALAALGAERFDYLLNNAGTSNHTPIAQMTEEEFDGLYRVHLKGVFFLTQKLAPLLNDGGRIINISTALTRVSMPGSSAYAAMKGAVEVLTRYFAKEFGPRGIAANTVAPGAVATDFSGGMVRDNPQVNKMVADNTALGRAGVPDDLGPMIAALFAEDQRWVNGQRIEVSGGMLV